MYYTDRSFMSQQAWLAFQRAQAREHVIQAHHHLVFDPSRPLPARPKDDDLLGLIWDLEHALRCAYAEWRERELNRAQARKEVIHRRVLTTTTSTTARASNITNDL